jgi:hypothetical protein
MLSHPRVKNACKQVITATLGTCRHADNIWQVKHMNTLPLHAHAATRRAADTETRCFTDCRSHCEWNCTVPWISLCAYYVRCQFRAVMGFLYHGGCKSSFRNVGCLVPEKIAQYPECQSSLCVCCTEPNYFKCFASTSRWWEWLIDFTSTKLLLWYDIVAT